MINIISKHNFFYLNMGRSKKKKTNKISYWVSLGVLGE